MSPFESAAFLLLAWALYYALHSLLASFRIKQGVRHNFPKLYKRYRLLYNLIAFMGLGGLVLLHTQIPTPVLIEAGKWRFIPAGICMLLGGGLGLLALRQYDLSAFVGTKPLPDQPDEAEEPFVSKGLNAHMRHPLYTAISLILTGGLILRPTLGILILWIAGLAYIRIGIFFEEKKLLRIYGEPYANYRRQVPMLIPRMASLF